MKKIILFIQFICFTVAFANAQRTIEVTVQDSIYLKLTGIKYAVGLDVNTLSLSAFDTESYLDDLDLDIDGEEEDEEPKRKSLTHEEIVAALVKGKFSFEAKSSSNYNLGEENSKFCMVSLKDETELKRLFELFNDNKEVEGEIVELIYEPLSIHHEVMYKKLYNKALKEAKVIAEISGQSIGALVGVSENKGEMDRYMQMYEEVLSRMPFGQKKIIDLKGKSTIVQRVYTFEIK